MQDDTGRMHNITPEKFKQMLSSVEDSNDVPVVKCGDVFKIRDCHFEVSEITETGIVAKGIRRGEFINKKFGC